MATVQQDAAPAIQMPSAFELNQRRMENLNKQAAESNAATQQQQNRWQQYMTGEHNPITELLKTQEPARNVDAEKRQKEVAKWAAISEGIGAIGKVIAAAGGVRQRPTQNGALHDSISQLRRLDDIYRVQKAHYDQRLIMDAIANRNRQDAIQNQLLSSAERKSERADALAYNAENSVIAMQLDAERQAQSEAVANSRHKEQMNYNRTTPRARQNAASERSSAKSANTAKSANGEKIAYYVNDLDNKSKIPIYPSDELRAMEWAKTKGKQAGLDESAWELNGSSDSAERRAKMQTLVHKMMAQDKADVLDKKYGPIDVVQNGVKTVNVKSKQLRSIEDKFSSIYNGDYTNEQKSDMITQLFSKYPDSDIMNEWRTINGY